ncbi:GrpB family protein [Halocatena salina]|uniref:GrpB family protein n=1 Tax=Halocatena salina TaxID=2934340 RepID=A0A8U0A0Q5_9EURY|nr:GrpB family protein [Halocatena salina]UPM42018.1 GrpB family protein [Halocatena salina]
MVNVDDDPIELVPSRHEAWCERYRAERERIRTVASANSLGSRLERIEHVGSTAVPRLPAKDIVDLDIVVADEAVAGVSRTLERELGGSRVENTEGWHPLFRRHDGQRFNTHVFGASDDGWKISVVTRDVLRRHPELREEYEQLKRELMEQHEDLTAYSRGKTRFIGQVLDTARQNDGQTYAFAVPSV